MGRKAFLARDTGLLKCHGFVQSNEPGDIVLEVPENFELSPGKWIYQDGKFLPYTAPETPDPLNELRRLLIEDPTKLAKLKTLLK